MQRKIGQSSLLGAMAIYGFVGLASAETMPEKNMDEHNYGNEAVESKEALPTEHQPSKLEDVEVYAPALDADVVISQDHFNKKSPSTLAELFDNTPGVGVGGGELPMAQKIFIRGMDDIMLNVSVDGAARNGEVFHHQSRIAINPDILEAVEVNAGVSSALNGPGGLGGSINFVTKSPFDLLKPEQTLGGSVKLGADSVNGATQVNVNAYGVASNESIGYLLLITKNQADAYVDGNGDDTKFTDYNQLDLFGKVDVLIDDNQNLVLTVNKLQDNGSRNERPQFNIDYRGEGTPVDQEFSTLGATANYSLVNDIVNLEATVHTSSSDLKMTRGDDSTLGGTNRSSGFDIRDSININAHSIVVGADLNVNTSEALNDT